ncbi:MAG: hypothetical protein GTO54_08610 [Nitrososphaeria archaeon]|nr:hypothetical protein [Nitrososphaeria archaeon]
MDQQKNDTSRQQTAQEVENLNKTAEDKFLEGFILKCAENQIEDPKEVEELLLKFSATVGEVLSNPIVGAGLGGALGLGTGYLTGLDPLISGAVGAGLGGLGASQGVGRLLEQIPQELPEVAEEAAPSWWDKFLENLGTAYGQARFTTPGY